MPFGRSPDWPAHKARSSAASKLIIRQFQTNKRRDGDQPSLLKVALMGSKLAVVAALDHIHVILLAAAVAQRPPPAGE